MRKHYIVTYGFRGVDFFEYSNSFAASYDNVNCDVLANQIVEDAYEHAHANIKNRVRPHTGVAILKLIELFDEQIADAKGESNAS